MVFIQCVFRKDRPMDEKNEQLFEDANNLAALLEKISNDYSSVVDEYENEMFYSGLQKAKEFSSNLILICNNRREKK